MGSVLTKARMPVSPDNVVPRQEKVDVKGFEKPRIGSLPPDFVYISHEDPHNANPQDTNDAGSDSVGSNSQRRSFSS